MGGHKQYQRLAKPMGMVDLDENEFDNFLNLKRKGGIFDRLKKCSNDTKSMRFSNKKGKKDYMKECMKKSGEKDSKAIRKKTNITAGKIKAKMEALKEKQKLKEELKMRAKPTEQSIGKPNQSETITTPPPVKPPTENKNKKLLLYGAIGVVALVIGLKIFKN